MGSATERGRHQPAKAAARGWIGSALERYDFSIYATAAALVFPQLFFPSSDPTAAIAASLPTYGVGYVARPVGAFMAPPGSTDIPLTVGGIAFGITVISALAAFSARETYRVHVHELGLGAASPARATGGARGVAVAPAAVPAPVLLRDRREAGYTCCTPGPRPAGTPSVELTVPAPSDEFFPRDRSQQPDAFTPGYKSTTLRSPRLALWSLQTSLSEVTGPVFGHDELGQLDNDLLRNHAKTGEPIGERTVVHGRVLDENARPVPGALLEVWQANAGGRYRHRNDTYMAPIDPNFGGCGRTVTRADGSYQFRTVKPGAYPFRNHANSWRPAHIHFSLSGSGFAQRLVTQMYFEGDPLIPMDVILNTIPDPDARRRLVAALDLNHAVPLDSLAYRFDIVLRGKRSTVFENKLHGS